MIRILQLIIMTAITDWSCHAYTCLTWELQGRKLQIIYRTNDFNTAVYFYDNRGKLRGFCSFQTSCQNIMYNKIKGEVVLFIKAEQIGVIDRDWLCIQGQNYYATHVSSYEEFDTSTLLKMKGLVIKWKNKQFVEVKCYSCREPYLNRMEYIVNNRIEDMITFKNKSKACLHSNGECKMPTCSCSPIGNEFTRAYEKNGENKMAFTCGGMFKIGSNLISKVANLKYDGNDDFISEVKDTVHAEDTTYQLEQRQREIYVYVHCILLLFIMAIAVMFVLSRISILDIETDKYGPCLISTYDLKKD